MNEAALSAVLVLFALAVVWWLGWSMGHWVEVDPQPAPDPIDFESLYRSASLAIDGLHVRIARLEEELEDARSSLASMRKVGAN